MLLKGFRQNLPPSEGVPVFLLIPTEKAEKWGFLEAETGREIQSLGKSGKTDPCSFIKQARELLLAFIPSGNHFQKSQVLFLIPHLLHSHCSKTNCGAWKKGRERLNPRGKKLGWNIPSSWFLPGLVSLGNENFLIGFSWWEVRKIPCLVGENWDFLQPWDVFHLEIPRDGLENEMSRWEVGNSS